MEDELKITFSNDYYPYHTDFAEDLFESGLGGSFVFKSNGDLYISDKISVKEIYAYCKELYGWKSDSYNHYMAGASICKLETDYMYFSFTNEYFIILKKEIDNSTDLCIKFAVKVNPTNKNNHNKHVIERVDNVTSEELVKFLRDCNIDNYLIMLAISRIGNHTEFYKDLYNKINRMKIQNKKISEEEFKAELLDIMMQIGKNEDE